MDMLNNAIAQCCRLEANQFPMKVKSMAGIWYRSNLNWKSVLTAFA
jgi:hypothetical protein